MSLWNRHAIFEKNSIILVGGILAVIAIGGLVEITPLFYLKSTIEAVDGVRPYTPLELAGRNIYVREGCYLCHSQMIRPLRDEVERYGHYSLAAESMYDRPFQWGSKRTGPDLARVGNKYSDDWHRDHLRDPRSVVPGSVTLDILLEQREKVVVGLSASGQVREFQLRTRLRFRLRSAGGRDLIPDTELLQQRDISFNESSVLSKESEENLLYRDMQTDLVQQLMRRLAAIKAV